MQDRGGVSMLQVPGWVEHWASLVHALFVMLHRLPTFGHWLSAVQLVRLMLHVPGTIGHSGVAPGAKHAARVWLQLPATVGQSALD